MAFSMVKQYLLKMYVYEKLGELQSLMHEGWELM